jgi:linoleate 9S-lipoxygenase
LKAFDKYAKKIQDVDTAIEDRNVNQPHLKNRYGPVKLPYQLLRPFSDGGLTGKGVPNSVSI